MAVYPQKEALLIPWGLNLKTKLATLYASVGVTLAQSTAYGLLYDDFETKWNVCQVPATKTKVAVSQKNISKRALTSNISLIAAIAQNFPGTTNALRAELGLPPRAGTVTPINPPTEKPVLEIVEVDGRRVSMRLRSADSDRRSKPAGVYCASVWSFVGEEPPSNLDDWENIGEVTRTDFDSEFSPSVPAGSMCWVLAFWRNPRMQAGPACDPVRLYLGGGVSTASA